MREWVRALIPFGCRIVLLGRTDLHAAPEDSPRATGIHALLAELSTAGIEAVYLSCDAADPIQTEQAFSAVESRFGHITGVIHGAGILRDNYVPQISADDFTAVCNTKLQGAANLFQAAEKRGLRFFVAVSSVAAFNGNPGQANYAAANRAMTAYIEVVQSLHPDIRCRAFLLGPVEGGGMADTEDIRALMRRGGYSYIHAMEVAQLVCREMEFGDPAAGPVLLVRGMPFVPTAPPLRPGDRPDVSDVSIFPLVDMAKVDLKGRSLAATRTFTAAKDLWLSDHRPLPGLKHPLVSGIMMLEAFAESAKLLYPHLQIQGFRDVRFIDIIECPDGRSRLSRIDCRTLEVRSGTVICSARLHTRGTSPSGRELEHWGPTSKGRIALGPAEKSIPFTLMDFPVSAAEFSGQTFDRAGLLEIYERYTVLQGRYRVLDAITGIGADSVEVTTVLQESRDFATHPQPPYQAMPYLLEAMFHAVDFQTLLMLEAGREKMIVLPYAFSTINFHRHCKAGEHFRVQARRRSQNENGVIWDAVVFDVENHPVISARGLEMRWLFL